MMSQTAAATALADTGEELLFRAVFEDGVLRPDSQLDVPEHCELVVRARVVPAISWTERTHGILKTDLPAEVHREILDMSVFDIGLEDLL